MPSFQFPEEGITYTKAELKIVNYIYQNLSSVLFLSIGQLSERLGVSEATISRFVRHVGYQDFKDLKSAIAMHMGQETPAEKMAETLAQKDVSQLENLLRQQQLYIEKTLENLDAKEVATAVEALARAKQIYVHGKGAAKGLAELLSFRLKRFGKKVNIITAGGSEIFEELIHIGPEDLVVLFAFQKTSKEAQVILKHCKMMECQTLLFSSRLIDAQQKRADINLFVYRGESKAYHSMAVPTALIDALIVMTAASLGDLAVEKLSALHELKENYISEIPR